MKRPIKRLKRNEVGRLKDLISCVQYHLGRMEVLLDEGSEFRLKSEIFLAIEDLKDAFRMLKMIA